MRAVGARKKSGFWGTWSILEQVGGRGRYVVEGGWGGGVFLRAGDLEVFLKNFWGSEPYEAPEGWNPDKWGETMEQRETQEPGWIVVYYSSL